MASRHRADPDRGARSGEPDRASRASASDRPARAADSDRAGRIEVAVAALLSLAAVALHVVRCLHAGGLWRDEAAALEVARSPTWSGLRDGMAHEIMPVLPLTVFRFFGDATDQVLRVLGCGIGLVVVGALWFSARATGRRAPVVSVLLLGTSAVVVGFGDSIRHYGMSMVFVVLLVGATWRVVESRTASRIAALAVLGVFAVQCAYSNAFLLLGAAAGGAAVLARRREWKGIGTLAACGAIAALSLMPYAGHWRRMAEWAVVVQSDVTLSAVLGKAVQSLGSPHPGVVALWAVALAATIVAAFRGSERALYAAVAIGVGTAGFLVWLVRSRYITYEWNYLPLVALLAACVEIGVGEALRGAKARRNLGDGPRATKAKMGVGEAPRTAKARAEVEGRTREGKPRREVGEATRTASVRREIPREGKAKSAVGDAPREDMASSTVGEEPASGNARTAVAAVCGLLAVVLVPMAWNALEVRQTNADLLAAKLNASVASDDLVVVNPWYGRLSLQRYYRGSAPMITVPPMEPVRYHRFDLVKEKMSSENVVAPVVEAMTRTLKSGHRVWIYGGLHFLGRGVAVPTLAPAPRSGIWSSYVYDDAWSSQVAQAILPHVTKSDQVEAPSADPISAVETLPLFVVEGWK